MKKLISYPLSWLLYYIGDLCYPSWWWAYKHLMSWSVRIQEWGGAGVWITHTEQEKQDFYNKIEKDELPDNKE